MSEYLLIEKKIREMIIYNNLMVMQFPKYEKHLLANKIRGLGYDLLELAIICNKKLYKKTTLTEINIKHELLRQLVNLSFELKYINNKKYQVSSLKIEEVGRMIGAWINILKSGDA